MEDETQLINCTFDSDYSLYLAYMPFIQGGGLFLRTDCDYPLGKELNLSITLMDQLDPYTLLAKVVWITPRGAQENKPPGIGVQFIDENGPYLCQKIETSLARMLKSTQPTDTL